MASANDLPKVEPELLRRVREREASVSIGASTARGMAPDTVKVAREFLRYLDLERFVVKSEEGFLRRLDEATDKCAGELPRRSSNDPANWGGARKFINIFLRGALYNRFLCDHYHLRIIERFLEVPLDKSVAIGLRRIAGADSLPPWSTIIRLKRSVSAKYQEFARRVAKRKGIARVHLDLWYYRHDQSEGFPNP
jgi:hypothetical protein